ncbi:MAG: YdcF family protein [Ferruginibacter sp.]
MRFLNSSEIKYYHLFLNGYFLSILLISCSYSAKTTKKLLEASKSTVYDILVVPGAPLENEKWSMAMKGRIYWAKYLYDEGIAKNIIFSGSAVYTPYYEGIIMALYAIAIGIPPEHVFYETRAEHSTENIYYSYVKAKELGFKKIALASDPFQTKTLRRFTRKKLSRDVGMLPMVMDTMKMLEFTMIDPVIDFQKAYDKDFISIKKRQGFFKRLKGTLGYNIKKDSFK